MYKAKIIYNSPDIDQVTSTPQYNMAIEAFNDQLVFTHPCISPNTNVQATLCEQQDDEMCVFFIAGQGNATLYVKGYTNNVTKSIFSVNVAIDI